MNGRYMEEFFCTTIVGYFINLAFQLSNQSIRKDIIYQISFINYVHWFCSFPTKNEQCSC